MGSIRVVDHEGFGPLIYKFDSFHSHAKAEHTLDGKRDDLEVHFVHVLDKESTRPLLGDRAGELDNYQHHLCVLGIIFRLDKDSDSSLKVLDLSENGSNIKGLNL